MYEYLWWFLGLDEFLVFLLINLYMPVYVAGFLVMLKIYTILIVFWTWIKFIYDDFIFTRVKPNDII